MNNSLPSSIATVSTQPAPAVEDWTQQPRTAAAGLYRFHDCPAPTSPAYKTRTHQLPLHSLALWALRMGHPHPSPQVSKEENSIVCVSSTSSFFLSHYPTEASMSKVPYRMCKCWDRLADATVNAFQPSNSAMCHCPLHRTIHWRSTLRRTIHWSPRWRKWHLVHVTVNLAHKNMVHVGLTGPLCCWARPKAGPQCIP
jgi:hypothetical protein